MINKKFHNLLKGVSVLPALVVAPALATSAPGIGFMDSYVEQFGNQLYTVLDTQNTTGGGFNIGTVTIGTNMSSVNDNSLRYGVANRDAASQYVHMTNVSMPNNFGDICLKMPLYEDEAPYGLTDKYIGIMKAVLNSGDLVQDGFAKPKISQVLPLLGSLSNMETLGGRTWLVNAASHAISDGHIDGGYLYTNNSFVVDGNYGNMVGTLLDTYKDSLKSILDELAPEDIAELDVTDVANRIARRLGEIVLNASPVPLESDPVNAGNQILMGAFGVDAGFVAAQWQNGGLKDAIDYYIDDVKTVLADLNGLKLNVEQITMNGGNVAVENIVSLKTKEVAINGGNVAVNTDASLTIDGTADNIATVNIAEDAKFVNDGILVFGKNTTVNIGSNGIAKSDENTSDTVITLNGMMNAIAREGADAQFVATTFDGTGILNLSFANEGTYHVFSGTGFSDEQVKNSVYDLSWSGGDVTATLKSTANIAKDNDLTGDAAAAVAGLASSSSEKLNNIGLEIQELLAEGTPAASQQVEEATAALNPETASVVQSAATSVQNTVTNLAASRMSLPASGRNGGDFDLNAKGAWAQGLYNKTKMNDQFNGYTRGVAAGVDGTINKDITVGLGYAFNNSDIASNSRDTDIDSNTLFLYGQYKPAEWYVNAVASYTWADYSEKGTVMGTPKTADYDVGSFGFAVAGGYDFDFGVTPELGLRYIHVGGDTYIDSLGVKNKVDATNYLTAMLGAKYGFDITSVKDVLLRPELRYAIKYDLISDESSATVAMPGANAYTLTGDRLSRFGNEFGIGLTMRYNTMDLSLTYDIEVREDYTSQTGMLKFRYEF